MTQTAGEPQTTMSAAFIGHGTLMNALDYNRFTDAWRASGAGILRPRAAWLVDVIA